MLGNPEAAGTRRVDVLLGAVGVNDLGFSGRLDRCARFYRSCKGDESIYPLLDALPAKYKKLDQAVSANLNVDRTYMVGYPARLFTNSNDKHDVCEAFTNKGFGMTDGDASWLSRRGEDLNGHIANAVNAHNAQTTVNPWTFIPLTDLFRKHGYCAGGQRWFRHYHESFQVQFDTNGTAHPNRLGHKAAASIVRANVPR